VSKSNLWQSPLTVMALFLCVAGCGNATQPGNSAREVTEVAPVPPRSAIIENASTLFDRWYGSEDDRSAIEVLVAYELNGAKAACMAASGYKWDWASALSRAETLDPLGPSVWTNEPKRRPFSQAWMTNARFASAELEMNADEVLTPEEEAALNDCESRTKEGSEEVVEKLREPEGRAQLMSVWKAGLRSATDSFGTYQDYEKCMASAEIPVLGGRAVTYSNMDEALRNYAPKPIDIPFNGRNAGPTWEKLLAMESPWVEADWVCRAENYERAVATVPEFLTEFEDKNAAAIQGLESYWQESRQKARALGWNQATGLVTEDN
jgi:hypothetical protein